MDCVRCKGNTKSEFSCGKQFCPIMQKFKSTFPKISLNFSGSSPPDLFVGQFNYPNVFAGILAPVGHDETAQKLSSPEEWFKEKMSIDRILQNRGSMIYSRFTSNIKAKNRLLETMQEVSMAKKPCDIEFILAKKPSLSMNLSSRIAPICNPAPLLKATLQENPRVEQKVEKAVSDIDFNATSAVCDLHKSGIQVSSMIKLLSAGLLGVKTQRKLVPSKWATTAVDDIISKSLVRELKQHRQIDSYLLFNGEYIGNHYEIILIPREWSFEVIEAKMPGSCWNPNSGAFFCSDNEDYYGRKEYASEVTGAYYSCRLAAAEHLNRLKRQASVLVLREVREEYFAPCGVGILRETVRNAFEKKPESFNTLNEALNAAQARMKIPVNEFRYRSALIREAAEQRKLFEF